MIWSLATGLAGKILPAKWVRAGAWFLIVLIVLALLFAGWQMLKSSIIKTDRAQQRAEQAEVQLERQGAAGVVENKLEQRDAAKEAELKGAADDAKRIDPTGAAGRAGPVSNAVADKLRRQREARERKPAGD